MGEGDDVDLQQTQEPRLTARMTARIDELMTRKDFEFAEVISGLIALGWAVILLMPWHTFTSARSFDVMAAIAPEWVWGLLFGWVGITQVGALLLDHHRPRLWSSLGASMAWVFVACVLGYANPYGLALVVYIPLSAGAAWSYWRLMRTGVRG